MKISFNFRKTLPTSILLGMIMNMSAQNPDAQRWQKYELSFTSSVEYENPVQDLKTMEVTFVSPTGIMKTVNGFWDGDNIWKVRFMPGETGIWTYNTKCSDVKNSGLDNQTGSFKCRKGVSEKNIFIHGPVFNPPGTFYLAHNDGTPFFWLACTAWNGALKSTDQEWDIYLRQRVENNYTVVQFVTTQWRGCDKSSDGLVAFKGCGKISINPEFFRLIDRKIDRINDYGLVAAPVILWALQTGNGKELSPGYYLPDDQAILLARYIVARYGANHVVWFLGGDGNYTGTYEQRWKTIGRAVFDGNNQGIVAMHPQGRSWIGEAYRDEPWLNIIGYQSSHSNGETTVNWITKGPVSRSWNILPARPLINLEPNYEEIRTTITDKDVRNAAYWSLFAAPVAGVSYGANGIWPWLREGEKILNHSDAPWTSTWDKSIGLPGSMQMGYLAGFIQKFNWWTLYPANELLTRQPGDEKFNSFVSLVKSVDNSTILGYMPEQMTIEIRKPAGCKYDLTWFDPVENSYIKGNFEDSGTVLKITSPGERDMLIILESKE
jgi:hypothetical protein